MILFINLSEAFLSSYSVMLQNNKVALSEPSAVIQGENKMNLKSLKRYAPPTSIEIKMGTWIIPIILMIPVRAKSRSFLPNSS